MLSGGRRSGDACYHPTCDLDASGVIDVIDIMRVVADWGGVLFVGSGPVRPPDL